MTAARQSGHMTFKATHFFGPESLYVTKWVLMRVRPLLSMLVVTNFIWCKFGVQINYGHLASGCASTTAERA